MLEEYVNKAPLMEGSMYLKNLEWLGLSLVKKYIRSFPHAGDFSDEDIFEIILNSSCSIQLLINNNAIMFGPRVDHTMNSVLVKYTGSELEYINLGYYNVLANQEIAFSSCVQILDHNNDYRSLYHQHGFAGEDPLFRPVPWSDVFTSIGAWNFKFKRASIEEMLSLTYASKENTDIEREQTIPARTQPAYLDALKQSLYFAAQGKCKDTQELADLYISKCVEYNIENPVSHRTIKAWLDKAAWRLL